VTPLRVVHFLEACLQYQHHPVINLMQEMLELNGVSDPRIFSTGVWIAVETRSMLFSRGCVVEGDLMQPYHSDFNYSESFVKDGGALQTKGNIVRRADASAAVDEMFRNRGQFGPAVYLHIYSKVNGIPAVKNGRIQFTDDIDMYDEDLTREQTAQLALEYIDLEKFLEMLFFEFSTVQKTLRKSFAGAFRDDEQGQAQLHALPRDINGEESLKLDHEDGSILEGSVESGASSTRSSMMSTVIPPKRGVKFLCSGNFHAPNMDKIRNLLFEFMRCDEARSGMVPQEVFETIINNLAEWYLGDEPHNLREFIKKCKPKFTDPMDLESFSYIDLIADLLSWEFQYRKEHLIVTRLLELQWSLR
jgi:hypothetical protein